MKKFLNMYTLFFLPQHSSPPKKIKKKPELNLIPTCISNAVVISQFLETNEGYKQTRSTEKEERPNSALEHRFFSRATWLKVILSASGCELS